MKYLLILLYCLSSIYSFSQIDKKDLYGDWYSNINRNIYEIDTIILHKKEPICCEVDSLFYIFWELEKKIIQTGSISTCCDSILATIPSVIGKYKLKKVDFGEILIIEDYDDITYKYKIIGYTNNTLQIVRFDDLSEQKLYNHVDSLVYNVLKYDSTATNPAIKHLQKENSNAVIRDLRNENPKPLLVINDVITENYDTLKQIRLVETISIDYITNEKTKAMQLYGFRAANGVIIIQVSPKRYKVISNNLNR